MCVGYVGRQVLGQRIAAAAHDQHAELSPLALGASCHLVDDVGHLAVIEAGQLKVQVIGQVAHGLESPVDVDEAHWRSVGVLRLKDERGAKLGLAHGHAALLEQPRQRRRYGDKNESNDGAPHKEGSHGATSLLIEVNY